MGKDANERERKLARPSAIQQHYYAKFNPLLSLKICRNATKIYPYVHIHYVCSIDE